MYHSCWEARGIFKLFFFPLVSSLLEYLILVYFALKSSSYMVMDDILKCTMILLLIQWLYCVEGS